VADVIAGELASAVLALCRQRGWTVATAESCTGGLIAAALTDIAGSSDVVDRGYVSYSNAAKTEMLGVPAELIAEHGAVSEPVVRAMAGGARRAACVAMAVAVTGIAGPGGGSAAKPEGTVWLAVETPGGNRVEKRSFGAIGREAVRQATVEAALRIMRQVVLLGK
jgi:nicotinamide-nucleotide amidase